MRIADEPKRRRYAITQCLLITENKSHEGAKQWQEEREITKLDYTWQKLDYKQTANTRANTIQDYLLRQGTNR